MGPNEAVPEKVLDFAKSFILKNPNSSPDEATVKAGIRPSTFALAKRQLADEGLIKLSTRGRKRGVEGREVKPEGHVIKPKELEALVPDAILESDLLNDDEVRRDLIKQVHRIAFDLNERAETRLAATQVWAKLKDMASQKDLGPGVPKSQDDAIDRLSRIMVAVGLGIVVQSLQQAFPKVYKYEEQPNDESSASSGTSETPNPA